MLHLNLSKALLHQGLFIVDRLLSVRNLAPEYIRLLHLIHMNVPLFYSVL